ncbi:MAG TPA: CRISPR-associated helicase Cas3' [Isosphaeraceae bacterium]|nr:CRISPR-associated helicase Cas3' [Isosphaeraceae bacterium]
MTADWMASGAVGREDDLDAARSVVRVAPRCLEDHMHDRAEQKNKQFERYTKFQNDCGNAPGHVMAVAPTGSGKTEASWLWALKQIEQGHSRKIIVLLPTMVTSNSIHERLRDFFEPHGHQVGLVHSTADFVRESKANRDAADHETDRADVRSNNLSESHYFRPVTVGTVDQLLVPLFQAGRWAMKTLAAADAAVVIDEIHAYEPHTLGLITLMIEQLATLGTRFMVMSATMPTDLRKVLHDALAPSGAGLTPVEDDELLDSARNIWTTSDKPLSESLLPFDATNKPVPSPEFLSLWGTRNDRGEPLKILVVVNTVAQCQMLSRAFCEFGFELTCYHSKFIFDHRREKERRINECPPRLLIATQVVEVSLDIDYDILLTECAPIDALVQRAGRVNRARRATLGRVVVHPHEKKSENVYGFPTGVLETTWALFKETQEPTERDLITMVEDVYHGYAPKDDEGFRGIQRATKNIQDRLCGVLDAPRPYEDDALLKTRKDDYPQISVIPEPFAEEAFKSRPRDRKRFELKVPVWYARQHLDKSKDLPICAMHYDDEFGAELLATSEEPVPGNLIF